MRKTKLLTLFLALMLVCCTALFVGGCKKGNGGQTVVPPVNNDGGYEVVTKIDPPTINILPSDGFSTENAPDAVINKAYKLFDAEASDYFGVEIDVKVKVWRFYYSETAVLVDFDGEFVPTNYGKYTVEYTATDKIGNKAVETYDFECKEKEELTATFDEGDVVTECFVGEEITIADIDFENFIGTVDCKIYAESKSSGVVTEITDGSVIPTYIGDYEIRYEYSDYNESGVKTYTVDVKEYAKPRIYGDVVLNKYYIKDCEYTLPELDCISYIGGGPAKVQPEIYAIYNGKLPEKVDPNAFVPKYEGSFRLRYVASVNGQTEEKVYTTTCVDTGYDSVIMVEKYFSSESVFTATALKSGVELSTTDRVCEADFINPLLSRKLEVKFAFVAGNNFTNFNFYLEDSLDSNVKVKIGLVKSATGEVLYSINDGQSLYKTDINFNSDITNVLTYDESDRTIVFNSGIPVNVKRDYAGNDFTGFPSGSMYLSYEFVNVNSKSSVVIKAIDNQMLSEGCRYAAPYIVYKQYRDGVKNVGDTIELTRIYAGGVLIPNFEVSYSIEGPDGNAPVDVNGVVLNSENMKYYEEYAFKPQLVGLYSVDIIAKNDRVQNPLPLSYSIEVVDSEAPVIKLEGEFQRQYELGSKFTALKATVTDNISEANKLCIYVYAPDGVLYEYKSDTEFVLNQVGEYTVYYQALDEAENVAHASYTFEVVVK